MAVKSKPGRKAEIVLVTKGGVMKTRSGARITQSHTSAKTKFFYEKAKR